MNEIILGGKRIEEGGEVFVVAEAGSNHDGDFDRALELIDAAAGAGADAVKFQSFTGGGLVNPVELPEAFEMLERLKTPAGWLPELKARCDGHDVVFISTPFDEDAVDALEAAGVEAYKIASGDATHIPLIQRVAQTGKPVFMSVGACTMDEIDRAVVAVRNAGNDRIVLLQCAPLYPADNAGACVGAMAALRARFGVRAGYSDHTMGEAAALAAAACGAAVYERHFTLDRSAEGPDHSFAIMPGELAGLIKKMKAVTLAMGGPGRSVPPREKEVRPMMRRGVYAAREIPAGAAVEKNMLKFVRPCKGAGPEDLESILGRKTLRAIEANQPVDLSLLE